MKTLTISFKSSSEALSDFQKALKKARSGKLTKPHYEISFDNKKDFDRFVKNMHILSLILNFKPNSVYELAKLAGTDLSNLNKVVLFFEEIGALKIIKRKTGGKISKKPVVSYDSIRFDLRAA